jgi:hypothetical protein
MSLQPARLVSDAQAGLEQLEMPALSLGARSKKLLATAELVSWAQ